MSVLEKFAVSINSHYLCFQISDKSVTYLESIAYENRKTRLS